MYCRSREKYLENTQVNLCTPRKSGNNRKLVAASPPRAAVAFTTAAVHHLRAATAKAVAEMLVLAALTRPGGAACTAPAAVQFAVAASGVSAAKRLSSDAARGVLAAIDLGLLPLVG